MESKYYEFIEDKNGIHQIGGKIPTDFKIPVNDFISSFQYIGYLNNEDEKLGWLPFKLHLICPIYLNIDKVFLDYTEKNQPQIISPNNAAEIDSEYLELNADSYIEFESRQLALKATEEIDDMECIGITKNPFEVQNLEIPTCPKSNREMKFVCQLMTFEEISVVERNFETDEEYLGHMNFWCDGSLFVFCDPDSKTICYFIQST